MPRRQRDTDLFTIYNHLQRQQTPDSNFTSNNTKHVQTTINNILSKTLIRNGNLIPTRTHQLRTNTTPHRSNPQIRARTRNLAAPIEENPRNPKLPPNSKQEGIRALTW